jgi:hypothetical protein
MSDFIDQNGNVRTMGYGQAGSDLVRAVVGSPKADAEAENFRTTSEFNKLRLDEAKKAADDAAKLEPHKKRINELISGWSDPDTTKEDPESGSTHPIVIPGKKHAPLFTHDPKYGFRIDETIASERLPEYLSILHRVYGHDALTKMHPFFNQAGISAPKPGESEQDFTKRTGRTPDGANYEGRYGQNGLINAIDKSLAKRTPEQEATLKTNAITAGRNSSDVLLDSSVFQKPDGIHIGPNSPLGVSISRDNGWSAPTEGSPSSIALSMAPGGNRQPNAATPPVAPEKSPPTSAPQAVVAPPVTPTPSTPAKAQPTIAGQVSSPPPAPPPAAPTEPAEPQALYDLDTPPPTKQTAAGEKVASSGKIPSIIAAGGQVTRNPDGSMTFKPAQPGREPNADEAKRQVLNEIGTKDFPTNRDKLDKIDSDEAWLGKVVSKFSDMIIEENGRVPDPTQLGAIASEIDATRADLEKRGLPWAEARSVSISLFAKKFKERFQTNPEYKLLGFIGPDRWAQDKIERKPSSAPNATATEKTNGDVSPQLAAQELRTLVDNDNLDKIPNPVVDSVKNTELGLKWLESIPGFDMDKVPEESLPLLKQKLADLFWMKDVVSKAPNNGYKFSSPAKTGGVHTIKTMPNPREDMQRYIDTIKQYEDFITRTYIYD